ncbi:hypothetical protein OHA71_23720 [Streptomyces sp. NBC_00444]|uniref:hypothetical protein n=1 Tax=Streptomyces sp. NBC_00444 TaxID=2975744 RepID=UPI002E200580
MSARKPITPSRVIPPGDPLPAPAAPPPPPPVPPALPAVAEPDPDPDWWRTGVVPPPAPVDVYVHVDVQLPDAHLPAPVEPEPGPRWWGRMRIGYNLACAAAGFVLCGPWAWVLASVRDESLAGAWVMALIPLTVLAFVDNARRIEALHADPELWAPRLRAAIARVLLWAAVLATGLTLPVTTIVYAITGVPS